MPHEKDFQQMTEATPQDRAALVRCNQCWEDGERADLSIAALHRLADLGWIEEVNRRLWQISPEGMAVLEAMEPANAR